MSTASPISSDTICPEVGYIQCNYINKSAQLQVARISNIPGWRLEQVVLPGQQLAFEALSNARLEVYANESGVVTQIKDILCSNIESASKKSRQTIA